jgi:hypothetical protein
MTRPIDRLIGGALHAPHCVAHDIHNEQNSAGFS